MTILIRGREVLINKCDFNLVNQYAWKISKNGYVWRNHWNKELKKYEAMYLHRYLMNTPAGMDTDHRNRNKFDNRRRNLRITTRCCNNHNSPPSRKNTSGVKGVSWFKPAKLWRAYINFNTAKRTELGYFKNKDDAVKARRAAEKRLIKY